MRRRAASRTSSPSMWRFPAARLRRSTYCAGFSRRSQHDRLRRKTARVSWRLENIMCRTLWVMGAFTLLSTLAAAQATGPERQAAERDFGADRFVAGGAARVDKPVAGDLIAAGGHVEIDAPVGGDAVVAGG